MGSPCSLRVPVSSNTLSSAEALETEKSRLQSLFEQVVIEIGRLEAKYSRYLDGSLLTKMNDIVSTEPYFEVDDETAAILDYADTAWQQSEGLFDVTSGVLRRVWDFSGGCIPTPDAVSAVLDKVGWQKVSWNAPKFALSKPGMELDFGGCVKEYASDAAANKCLALGLSNALVELGGDVRVVHDGTSPSLSWPIAIRHPRNNTILKRISLNAGALASSGDYERFIELNGQRYSHILNPLTGWPVRTPASVSVIADNCLVAGTVSTVAMLNGASGCLDWLESIGLPYLCVFDDGRVVDKL